MPAKILGNIGLATWVSPLPACAIPSWEASTNWGLRSWECLRSIWLRRRQLRRRETNWPAASLG